MNDGKHKWVTSYLDRHGKRRWRFRRKGKTVALPGFPGEPPFELAYAEAVNGTRKKKGPQLVKKGIVYAVQGEPTGPVKIGFTTRDMLPRRLMNLQTGSAVVLRIVAVSEAYQTHERLAHHALAEHRLTGEWFSWSIKTETFVSKLDGGVDAALHAVQNLAA